MMKRSNAIISMIVCLFVFQLGVSALPVPAGTDSGSLEQTYQTGPVRGTVVDAAGNPVIGAGVRVPGTTTGTVTDLNGAFVLNVEPGSRLEISCIGYVTKIVAAAANMSVILEEDAEILEETIVIGYGSVKRSDLTSAVSKMDDSSIADRPMARAEQALQGQLAGVTVQTTNNEPGADPQIRVRGAASISAGSDPLYIIDGVPNNTLQGVNPNDIASIEVLKDAASAAIYGSRGSNGVILVTTKTGQQGAPKVSFNASYGLATMERKMDVLGSIEFMEFRPNTYATTADPLPTATHSVSPEACRPTVLPTCSMTAGCSTSAPPPRLRIIMRRTRANSPCSTGRIMSILPQVRRTIMSASPARPTGPNTCSRWATWTRTVWAA